jgi:hypothetical protein
MRLLELDNFSVKCCELNERCYAVLLRRPTERRFPLRLDNECDTFIFAFVSSHHVRQAS